MLKLHPAVALSCATFCLADVQLLMIEKYLFNHNCTFGLITNVLAILLQLCYDAIPDAYLKLAGGLELLPCTCRVSPCCWFHPLVCVSLLLMDYSDCLLLVPSPNRSLFGITHADGY
ncbi:hypothetical protein Nepgr_004007 [Nepenthes gracilis]|uniref:Uncharacterized protein n=1 Tax=Nepenthes gracilis TaxID=150966 RepID=A0AAD3S0J4_NEPGR|nr:hypothetical protein Nepgr_004007 [Nepenthes gracilis]